MLLMNVPKFNMPERNWKEFCTGEKNDERCTTGEWNPAVACEVDAEKSGERPKNDKDSTEIIQMRTSLRICVTVLQWLSWLSLGLHFALVMISLQFRS